MLREGVTQMLGGRQSSVALSLGLSATLGAVALAGCAADNVSESAVKSISDLSGEWVYEEVPEIWIGVDRAGVVGGSRGCTAIGSTVTVDDENGTVEFGPFESDGIQCHEPFDGAWDIVSSTLRKPNSATIDGDVLVIDGDLKFQRRTTD